MAQGERLWWSLLMPLVNPCMDYTARMALSSDIRTAAISLHGLVQELHPHMLVGRQTQGLPHATAAVHVALLKRVTPLTCGQCLQPP